MQALVELLTIRRDAALRAWRMARGEVELSRHQAIYNAAQDTIDLIQKTPA